MSGKHLVIVESPAKAKTIGKYLGKDYTVTASMGHLRDLPKSKIGVDVENDFEPVYQPIKGKEALIKELKSAAQESDVVYLATDPDREGEAISWHLKALLDLDDQKAKRVTFNEITKHVVTESIQQPRAIDQNLVDAQQARRILDRIVGYELSPLLWKKVRRGLSAGRVQSVAMRMVDDREKEIQAFQPEEYWTLDALLKDAPEGRPFTVRYYGRGGKKYEPRSEAEIAQILTELGVSAEHLAFGAEDGGIPAPEAQNVRFAVKSVKRSEKQRSPSPPFTTSSLQQEASRKLNMTPRRTMALAQQLYEGVDVSGEGAVGLITYMRTDSLRISEEAVAAAKTFILDRYGEAYYPAAPRRYQTKAGAQDAHEAIRPSNVNLTPEQVKGDLNSDQYRLYRLIWSRFVASQMSNAVFDAVSVEIEAGEHSFRASASSQKFAGYAAVYEEAREDEEKEEKPARLPQLAEGQTLLPERYEPEQHFTQPPSRYTDATLIRALEQNGIGRPSTYAPTVSTILDREYCVKEGKYLRPTPLGMVVTGLMEEKFPDIVDTGFTARMEQRLDTVEEGKTPWKDVLRHFYGGFSASLHQAEEELEGVHLKVPDEPSDEICDVCGRQMVIKSGRYGRFLACPGYPECTFTKPLVVVAAGSCPKCGGRMMKRAGVSKRTKKHYTYYACEYVGSKIPEKLCDFMTFDVPTKDDCPSCGKTMFKRSGRGFKRPYCINPECENFVPEEKRGYTRKSAAAGGEGQDAEVERIAGAVPEELTEPEAPEEVPKETPEEVPEKPAKRRKVAKKEAAKDTKKAVKKTEKKTSAVKKAAKTTRKAAEL